MREIAPDRRRHRGRILAVKLGYNPNSSSLGVDVTFLLFGMTLLALLTPVIGLLLRWRRREEAEAPPPAADADEATAGGPPGAAGEAA